MSDSCEAVREPYWKLLLARGVCTGGLHMAAVKEQGDMMAACCSAPCGLVKEEFRLLWERLGGGYPACAAAAAAAATGSMRAAEALAIAEAL